MEPIIRFDQVGKRYVLRHDRPRAWREVFVRRNLRGGRAGAETLWALRDVSFAINRGETVGLVGPNGAGKSTALKLLSRVIEPTTGRVSVTGRVAALLELGTGFHPELSGRENVYLSAALVGMTRQEMQRKFPSVVEFSELHDFIDMPVKHYSSGMFARLAFAVSIHLEPEVLLVDEVLAVGDQSFQRKCLDRIAELQHSGVTIFLVSHSPDTVRSLCTRAIWFDHGRVMGDGDADSVVLQYLTHDTAQEAERLAGQMAQGRMAPPTSAQTQPLSGPRWGSGRVQIERVRLMNAAGQEQMVFKTGEPLLLQYEYIAHESIARPVFGMSLTRSDGVHISGPNTQFAGLEIPRIEGRGVVTFTVPALPLLDGLYHISAAAVNDDDTEMFDYHDRLYPFRVVNLDGGFKERYGLMTLNGAWQHAPISAAAPLAGQPVPAAAEKG